MDLNKAQIIGNVTQDIEVKQTPNGQNVTSFGIATNRRWTDSSGNQQEQTEFHNVVFWGKQAEIAGQYINKGDKLFVEGRLQTRNWEAQDGTKRYRTEIVGENMIMLGGRRDGGGQGSAPAPFKKTETMNQTPAVKNKAPKQEEEISIEDIPF